MSLSNILLIPGVGQMSFRDALLDLAPYSPRLAANFMDPAGSLYTDASRTTQVTTLGNRIRSFTNFVTGQPHGAASSDAKSPLWNEFTVNGRTVRGAVFDGSDDCLQVSGFDLSNTSQLCAIVGLRASASGGMVLEHSANWSLGTGVFSLFFGNDIVNGFNSGARGSIAVNANQVATFVQSSPISTHVSITHNISGDLSRIWSNATEGTQSTGDKGPGNFSSQTLNIGGRNNSATLPLNGALSYLFICGAIPPDSILTKIYRGLAPQLGVAV